MKYLSPFFLLFLFCTGCIKTDSDNIPEHLAGIQKLTVYDSDETALYDIEFNRTQVFEESNELMFGRISGVAVDESERVYISEFAQSHVAIHVFDNDGSYLYRV
jgi:hypothetical protein